VNQGQPIEFNLKVKGPKPITVTWYNNDVKLKSSKNRKVTYSSTQFDAKLQVMLADEEDMGQYKIEASNEFGAVTQTCAVTVVCKYSFVIRKPNRYLTAFIMRILTHEAVVASEIEDKRNAIQMNKSKYASQFSTRKLSRGDLLYVPYNCFFLLLTQ